MPAALLPSTDMSGAAREKDQADFDLERFIEMFDEALTSRDPRVIDALRGLMMIVTLTRPESRDSGLHDRNPGPLRRLYDDMNHLNRRLSRLEDDVTHTLQQRAKREVYNWEDPYEKYSMKAAERMAQQVDQDLLNQLKMAAVNKVKGLK